MKAISLWQPWASLIAVGAKQYETRSWGTPYRGPLVIHASKTEQGMSSFGEYHIRQALAGAGIRSTYALPRGVALCVVNLVDCDVMTSRLIDDISEDEFAFGDWKEGRYAWKMEVVRVFDKPIPMRGMQGLFDVDIPQAVTR